MSNVAQLPTNELRLQEFLSLLIFSHGTVLQVLSTVRWYGIVHNFFNLSYFKLYFLIEYYQFISLCLELIFIKRIHLYLNSY